MKSKKTITIIVLFTTILISSIFMHQSYTTVRNKSYDEESTVNISNYWSEKLFYLDYVFAKDIAKKENKAFDYNNYIWITDDTGNQVKDFSSEEFVQDSKEFIEEVEKTDTLLQRISKENSNSDFFYFVQDSKTKTILTNNKEMNQSSVSNQKNNFDHYLTYTFGDDGYLIFSQSKGFNNNILFEGLKDNHNWNTLDDETDTVYSKSYAHPKDLSVTIGMSQKFVDTLETNGYGDSHQAASLYIKYLVPYLFIALLTVLIVTFFSKEKYLSELKLYNALSKIKFEILLAIIITPLVLMTSSIHLLVYSISGNYLLEIYAHFGIEQWNNVLNVIISLGFWFIYFFLISFSLYLLKFIHNKGLKNYFKENSIIGWIWVHIMNLINYLSHIDFNENSNKAIFRIVGINFIAISIISLFFVGGVFIGFIYSIALFIFLRKKYEKIQQDYKQLLSATRSLSNGNFNVDITQDIGLFNPLKEEFSHIKDGFEKAVNEEVKSQRMKTELISNVSHDLKTPLTSIISYTDLLKNPDLSDQDKEKYIQILDKNALRLKNLIADLFEVTKANTGNVKLEIVNVDINDLLKQCLFENQDKLEDKHLDIRPTYSDSKIICPLDSSITYRIFENLIINVSKYALSNTRVYIDVINQEDSVTLTFKNISEHEIKVSEEEIIERFVQGDDSRTTGGSGLGLAIAKSFTELQHGTFKVDIDADLFKVTLNFKKI